MSIYENIRFGKQNASKTEIEEAARQANAHDFIMRLPEVSIEYVFFDVHL
jgi:ABC-type multidrug transport system fused ATPase/permease subunit